MGYFKEENLREEIKDLTNDTQKIQSTLNSAIEGKNKNVLVPCGHHTFKAAIDSAESDFTEIIAEAPPSSSKFWLHEKKFAPINPLCQKLVERIGKFLEVNHSCDLENFPDGINLYGQQLSYLLFRNNYRLIDCHEYCLSPRSCHSKLDDSSLTVSQWLLQSNREKWESYFKRYESGGRLIFVYKYVADDFNWLVSIIGGDTKSNWDKLEVWYIGIDGTLKQPGFKKRSNKSQ